jgi:hypothetical protein
MLRRSREASERFAERRRLEDEAERLAAAVPGLRSLRLEVEEGRGGAIASETKHVRLVVVGRAPALFIFPCSDPACSDGGHDLTAPMLQELRQGAESFALDDTCFGNVGAGSCGRVLHVSGTAAYEKGQSR